MPAQFSDSSHKLWFCETVDGPMVLKLCDQQTIQQSTFWRGMNSLFDISFPASLGNIAEVYQYISNVSPLAIPAFIASQKAIFILAKWLPGNDVQTSRITSVTVTSLAKHLGLLHQQQHSHWGCLQQPRFSATEWSLRVKNTVLLLAQQSAFAVDKTLLQKALAQAEHLNESSFVPIMPDLRWDQFLMDQDKLSALVDLDAIVYGPSTLEFVLLEYLLDQTQAESFADEYQCYQLIPDLSEVRLVYRLLLFLMNVLGETQLDIWLNYPKRFY